MSHSKALWRILAEHKSDFSTVINTMGEEAKSIIGEQLSLWIVFCPRHALSRPKCACPGLDPQGDLTKATLFKMSLRIKASPSRPSWLPCNSILAVPGMF